jgi:hypothetical protein
VVTLEEEVDISSIPAAAREAIEKKAAGRKIELVERVTQAGSVRYESKIKKGLRRSEFRVNPDGTIHK